MAAKGESGGAECSTSTADADEVVTSVATCRVDGDEIIMCREGDRR